MTLTTYQVHQYADEFHNLVCCIQDNNTVILRNFLEDYSVDAMSDAGQTMVAFMQHHERLVKEHADMKAALAMIAKYGHDGICPYGCDCPHIAQQAIAAY